MSHWRSVEKMMEFIWWHIYPLKITNVKCLATWPLESRNDKTPTPCMLRMQLKVCSWWMRNEVFGLVQWQYHAIVLFFFLYTDFINVAIIFVEKPKQLSDYIMLRLVLDCLLMWAKIFPVTSNPVYGEGGESKLKSWKQTSYFCALMFSKALNHPMTPWVNVNHAWVGLVWLL